MRAKDSNRNDTKKKNTKHKGKGVHFESESKMIRVSSKKSAFGETESFRQLRTNIEFSSFSKDIKVVNTTSANPGEGKSTVACNLALISIAKYDKVLLIDCDMRKPVQHKIFKVSNQVGVGDLLKNLDAFDIEDKTYFSKIKYGDFPGNLYILPAGTHIPNPQELLASDKFKELLNKCREAFDFVIVDCPPLNVCADAIPVANACDGTVFVLSAKDTQKKFAKNAITELNRGGANVLGCVLNKVEAEAKTYYNYYAD